MIIETEIQAEVEALKARFPETKSLYREVCALLFFRHGITPTANKLYQFVRKGSMSAPSDALTHFWEELRGKAQVQIDHPDLPDALKATTAEAMQVLWVQATELARGETQVLRVEAKAEVQAAQQEQLREHQRAEIASAQIVTLQESLDAASAALRARDLDLEEERRSHAATTGRSQELQRQISELQGQLERARSDFSIELEKGRQAIASADVRAAGAQRHALMEVEQERMARARLEKQAESLRSQLVELEGKRSTQEAESAATKARLQTELDAARLEVRGQADVIERHGLAMTQAQQQLAAAQQEAVQHKTEAQTLRALVAQFRPTEKVERSKKGKAT